MKRILLASIAALTLCSGCIFDDEFWDDYDSGYDSPAGDDDYDCDCDDGEYFSATNPVTIPDLAPIEIAR